MRASKNSTTTQKSLRRERRVLDESVCVWFVRAIERLLNMPLLGVSLDNASPGLELADAAEDIDALIVEMELSSEGVQRDPFLAERCFRLAIDYLIIGMASMMWQARGRGSTLHRITGTTDLDDLTPGLERETSVGETSLGGSSAGTLVGTSEPEDGGIDRMQAFMAAARGASSVPHIELLKVIFKEVLAVPSQCGAKDPCSFFFDLQPSKLAMLYEYALAFRPQWDSSEGRAKLLSDDKAKKKLGNFYTPPSLADLAVRNAISYLVQETDGTVKPIDDILKLRVVDPASGGGSFLCSTLNYLDDVISESDDARRDGLTSTKNWREEIAVSCLYGVDLDAGAVSLCRTILFLESRTRDLAVFKRLHLRVKRGNSLIGAWKDACLQYPERALKKASRKEHSRQNNSSEENAKNSSVLGSQLDAIDQKTRMDLWCSIWFWNDLDPRLALDLGSVLEQGSVLGREFARVPGSVHDRSSVQDQDLAFDLNEWMNPQARTLERAQKLALRLGFFHWEIEFAEVFSRNNPGFDAVVGNPPWEIHKPNSREFFSRFDSEYWGYGKQRALLRQKQLCAGDPQIERMWRQHESEYSSFRHWIKHCSQNTAKLVAGSASPGPPANVPGNAPASPPANVLANAPARTRPFSHQGKADLNAYKLFLEQSLFLLREDGALSFIVPSSLYSDLGARELRLHLLKNFRWRKLLGFENSRGLFNIHRSFKFCIATVQRGEDTQSIETAFMLKDAAKPPVDLIHYSREAIQRFSPNAISIVEFERRRDIEIMEKIFSSNDAFSASDWNVQYEREFDMTNDSHLFLPRSDVEHSGYRADQYGNWLLGPWRKRMSNADVHDVDKILSADRLHVIDLESIEDLALPVYEGRMVGQFDFSQKAWVSGKGRRAVWHELQEVEKALSPQYLMRLCHCPTSASEQPLKCGFLGVGSPTNARLMIASALDVLPCGNSVPVLRTDSSSATLSLVACLNSYVFDFALRCRLSGNNLNHFLVAETPIISRALVSSHPLITQLAAALNLNHMRFSPHWLELSSRAQTFNERFNSFWAIADAQRRTLRALLDATIAKLYGLSFDDLSWILRGAGSVDRSSKGLWRSEQKVPVAHRPSELALRFRSDLENQSEQELFDCIVSHANEAYLPLDQVELELHAVRIAHLRAHQFNLVRGTRLEQPRHH